LRAASFSHWFSCEIVAGQQVHDCWQLTFLRVTTTLNSTNALQRGLQHRCITARLLH
jgi:hypothetical protein